MKRQDLEESVLTTIITSYKTIFKAQEYLRPDMFSEWRQEVAKAIWERAADARKFDAPSLIALLPEKIGLEITTMLSRDLYTRHMDEVCDEMRKQYLAQELSRLWGQGQDELVAGEDVMNVSTKISNEAEELVLSGTGTDQDDAPFLEVINQMRSPRPNILPGIPTGISLFDRETGGWQSGEYFILAGRPGMGKTTVMLWHALQAIQAGHRPVIYSLEMPAEQVIRILACLHADIDPEKVNQLTDSARERVAQSVEHLYDTGLMVYDTLKLGSTTIENICLKTQALVQRDLCDIVFLDYLQLSTTSKRTQDLRTEATLVSRMIMRTAQGTKIPHIILSQLSRDVEKRGGEKRPRLSDLRESGSLEQDATGVVFMYRAEYYGIEEDAEGQSTKGVNEWMLEKYRPAARLLSQYYALRKHPETGILTEQDIEATEQVFQSNPIESMQQDSYMQALKPMSNDGDIPF